MTDQTIAAVRRFSRFYTRQLGILDEGLLNSPFRLAEVRVMYEIAHGEEVSGVNLIEQLRLDPGYLSRILRRLQKAGLVSRRKSQTDGRRQILTLTAKGRREFEALDIQQDRNVAELLSGVGESRRRRLIAAMRLIESTLGGGADRELPVRIRPPDIGDVALMAHRFSRIFWEEYRYDERFEAMVLRIVAEFLKREPSGDQRCLIAERNGEILGGVLVTRRDRRTAQMRLLYVEPAERRRGIGKRLVAECIRFAREAGYRRLMLWTQNEETDARRLYERSGFLCVGRERHRRFTDHDVTGETWHLPLAE